LGRGRHAGVSGHHAGGGDDVYLLHLQFHRADHLDPARWRSLRLQPSGIWGEGRADCRAGDTDRARVRSEGLPYAQAAQQLAYLERESLRLRLSGIALKGNSEGYRLVPDTD